MRLILTRPHTHARTYYAAGDTLDASPAASAWLLAKGYAYIDTPEPEEPPHPYGDTDLNHTE